MTRVSEVTHKFVNDAREVVKTGQVAKVRVLEVELARKRISLTMNLDAPARTETRDGSGHRQSARNQRARLATAAARQAQGALAAAFAKLQSERS